MKNNREVPWAQEQVQKVLMLEQKIARLEHQLHEARAHRDSWQELAERLLKGKRK